MHACMHAYIHIPTYVCMYVRMYVNTSLQARGCCTTLLYPWPFVSVELGSEQSQTIQLYQLTLSVVTVSAVGTAQTASIACDTSNVWLKSPKISSLEATHTPCRQFHMADVKRGVFERDVPGVETITDVSSCNDP